MLTTAKDLEHIAPVQVDSGAPPYLGVLTIATGKQVQGSTEHIHTLLVEDDSRTACSNVIVFVSIEDSLAHQVLFHRVEHAIRALTIDKGAIDIDDHIAIDMTTLIATTIDITTREAAIHIFSGARTSRCSRGIEIHFISRCRTDGIPLQQF